MIIHAPFPPAQQIAHGQPRLNQPTSYAQMNLQAPLLQSALHQDLFQKQIQFRGAEPFSQTVKEAFQEYFWGLKQQEDDEPPETMADIKKIVRMLWEDKKILLEPDTLKALVKEKSSPEEQIKALEVMAGDMLLDKTQLKQVAIDSYLFKPTLNIPKGEARMEQVAQLAQAALKAQYPFDIPVSKDDVEQRIAEIKLKAVDSHLFRPITDIPQGEAGMQHVAKLAEDHLKKHCPFELPVSAENVTQRIAWITTHSPETLAKLKLQTIDPHLLRPITGIPQGEAGMRHVAKLAEDHLKKHYLFELPISADDIKKRIAEIAALSPHTLAKLKLQTVDSHLFKPIADIPQGEAGIRHVAKLAEDHLKKHYLFELPVSADDIRKRIAEVDPAALAKLKVQAIDSQLGNTTALNIHEGSHAEHIARQAGKTLKQQYLFEIPVTPEDVTQRIASLKKQIIDAHLEHPAFTIPKGESVAQYVTQKAQMALEKRFPFGISISVEDVEQQIALQLKNKPAKENKVQTFHRLKRLGMQHRQSPLSKGD